VESVFLPDVTLGLLGYVCNARGGLKRIAVAVRQTVHFTICDRFT